MAEFVDSQGKRRNITIICDSCGFQESMEYYLAPKNYEHDEPRLHPLPHGWESLVKGIVPEGIRSEPFSPEKWREIAEHYSEENGHELSINYEEYLERDA